MICSREDTGEGREQEKVNTKTKKAKAGVYLLPLAVALPIAAAMAYAVLRAWPVMQKLAGILIRMVVKA